MRIDELTLGLAFIFVGCGSIDNNSVSLGKATDLRFCDGCTDTTPPTVMASSAPSAPSKSPATSNLGASSNTVGTTCLTCSPAGAGVTSGLSSYFTSKGGQVSLVRVSSLDFSSSSSSYSAYSYYPDLVKGVAHDATNLYFMVRKTPSYSYSYYGSSAYLYTLYSWKPGMTSPKSLCVASSSSADWSGLAYDGAFFYTSVGSYYPGDFEIKKLDPKTCNDVDSINPSLKGYPGTDLAFGNGRLYWPRNYQSYYPGGVCNITMVDPQDETILGAINGDQCIGGSTIKSICTMSISVQGNNLWLGSDKKLWKLDATTGVASGWIQFDNSDYADITSFDYVAAMTEERVNVVSVGYSGKVSIYELDTKGF